MCKHVCACASGRNPSRIMCNFLNHLSVISNPRLCLDDYCKVVIASLQSVLTAYKFPPIHLTKATTHREHFSTKSSLGYLMALCHLNFDPSITCGSVLHREKEKKQYLVIAFSFFTRSFDLCSNIAPVWWKEQNSHPTLKTSNPHVKMCVWWFN